MKTRFRGFGRLGSPRAMQVRSILIASAALISALADANDVPAAELLAPPIKAKSAIVVDEKSGKVLFEKSADAKRFPASTTKILTTLLLLENCNPDEAVVAPMDIEDVKDSSLHLKPGETIKAGEIAYGLMVRSANDGAYAVAIHIAGSVPEFATMMNERAKRIGCKSTHFTNPNGLHDPNHYSTARDLMMIAREAMKNPMFRQVAATRKHWIERDLNLEDQWLISKNHFLEHDPSTNGIKTGYTRPAGHCFVGSATRNGYRFISVILASDAWKDDHKALINWAFKYFERSVVAQRGQVVGSLAVSGGPAEGIPVKLSEPVYYAHRKGWEPQLKSVIEPQAGLRLPVEEGQKVGFATYSDGTGWSVRVPVFAAARVSPFLASTAGVGHPWTTLLFAGMLGAGAYALRKKARRYASHGRKTT